MSVWLCFVIVACWHSLYKIKDFRSCPRQSKIGVFSLGCACHPLGIARSTGGQNWLWKDGKYRLDSRHRIKRVRAFG